MLAEMKRMLTVAANPPKNSKLRWKSECEGDRADGVCGERNGE